MWQLLKSLKPKDPMMEFIDLVGLDDDDKLMILFRFANVGYLRQTKPSAQTPKAVKNPMKQKQVKSIPARRGDSKKDSPIAIAERLISSFL